MSRYSFGYGNFGDATSDLQSQRAALVQQRDALQNVPGQEGIVNSLNAKISDIDSQLTAVGVLSTTGSIATATLPLVSSLLNIFGNKNNSRPAPSAPILISAPQAAPTNNNNNTLIVGGIIAGSVVLLLMAMMLRR